MEIAIDLIKPSPYQPRLTFEVEDLKNEIQKDGLLSALVVRKRDEHYELLDGERRLRALKELGWKIVPVDVRAVDDNIARRSVYKLNKIRENYTTEEEAKYFKKLFDEGMKPYQIETELGADHNWVQACLNIWKFPEDIRNEVFQARRGTHFLFMSDIQSMEGTIARNPEQAIGIAKEIIKERLNEAEKRKLLTGRVATIDEARVKAAQEALPEFIPTLETPEDMEKAAEALKREAQRRREAAVTPEERAALEAERQAELEAQALAKAQREEERKHREAERRRQLEETAMRMARHVLKADSQFIKEAWENLSSEGQDIVMGISVEEREKLEQGRPPRTPMDIIYELDGLAESLYHKLDELEVIPSAGIAILGTTLRSLQERITEVLNRMGLFEGKSRLIKGGE